MPVDEYTISSLTLSSGITNNDLIELATPDQSSDTGYSSVSATVVMLATKMLKNIQFASDLDTTDKTIIGAINEILAGGGGGSASILYGTSAPTAQQGSNGNLYVQYTEGTGGADDTVDALYVKLDNAWCEIETNGGASSADEVSFDDTDVAFEADDVQEAFENITKSMTYAEYEQLSSAEKNNGTIYLITDINAEGEDNFQPVIYSEDEREIGVWIDGKPLYQKTVDLGSDNYIKYDEWTDMGISATTYDNIVECFIVNASGTTYPLMASKQNNSVYCLACRSGNNVTGRYITLRYTKTTDTAGSGTWTPQGVPAHHYSTDEQVVGTWIDGSTIYERVFDLGSDLNVLNTEFTNTTIDASAMSKIISVNGMYSTGVTVYPLMANINNNIIRLQSDRNGTSSVASVRYIILRYTKSSS